MDARTIKSKIDALSRMTTANGCTEAEARNAAEMAGRLRVKLPPEEAVRTGGIFFRHASPEAPQQHYSQQAFNQQQTNTDSAMWRIFAQGLQGFGTPRYGNIYDAGREQSVLDDLDAFLGNQGTRRGTGGGFWSAPRSREDEARRQYNERTLRDKIQAGKVRF